jgi:hypothetical protein
MWFAPLHPKSKARKPERDSAQKEASVIILVGAPKKSILWSWLWDLRKTSGDHGVGAELNHTRVVEEVFSETCNTAPRHETRPSIAVAAPKDAQMAAPVAAPANPQMNGVATEPGNVDKTSDAQQDPAPATRSDPVPAESGRPAVRQFEHSRQPANSVPAQGSAFGADTSAARTPATETEATATAAAGLAHILDVTMIRGPMERLRSLDPASSAQLRADPSATFEPADNVKCQTLAGLLMTYWPKLYKGRIPMFGVCLVHVTDETFSPPKSLGTCICIRGYISDDEIKRIHAVLSQKSVRSHYAPLRVCYLRAPGGFVAKEVKERTSITHRPAGDWTLSGGLVRTENGDDSWETTIGGLIMVGDTYYLMTSSDHRQAAASGSLGTPTWNAGEGGGPSTSSFETLVDANFDDDVEQALVIGATRPEEEGTGPPIRASQTDEPLLLPDVTSVVGDGPSSCHWRLISATPSLRLPNLPSTSIPPDLSGPNPIDKYIEDYEPPQGGPQVTINAGVSGVGTGSLVGNPSYLVSTGGVQEVWAIQLHGGFRLQQGDSGSWVLSHQLRVIGSVIATSDDCAYMVSLLDQVKQIEHRLSAKVTIPKAFDLLANLAHYTFPSDPDRAMVYAHRALSPRALFAYGDSPHRGVPELNHLTLENDRERLAALICTERRLGDTENRHPSSTPNAGNTLAHGHERVHFPVGAQKHDGEALELVSDASYPGAEAAVASGGGRPVPPYLEAWSSRNRYQKAVGTTAATSGAPKQRGTGTVSAWTGATIAIGSRSMATTPGSREPAHPASIADGSTLVGHQSPSLRRPVLIREQSSIGQDLSRAQSEVRNRLTIVVVSECSTSESLPILNPSTKRCLQCKRILSGKITLPFWHIPAPSPFERGGRRGGRVSANSGHIWSSMMASS